MKKRKTEEIQYITHAALQRIPEPYDEDIIDRVLGVIENDPNLLKWYHTICQDFDNHGVVNTWIGKYTKRITKMMVQCNRYNKIVRATTRKTTLAETYTKLTYDQRRACK